MFEIWKNFWCGRDSRLVIALIAFIIMNLVIAVPYGWIGVSIIVVAWAFIIPAFVYGVDHPDKQPQKD